jgi:hypothetical protein
LGSGNSKEDLLGGTPLIEEVKVLDEEREEGNHDPLSLVSRSSRSPHGRLMKEKKVISTTINTTFSIVPYSQPE